MELFYGRKISSGWGITFLLTTQMIGYGFAGVFRDILVRPPKIYYPGVLPNVKLFSAMHKDPSSAKNALKFFGIVGLCAFCYEWFPSLISPVLAALPIVCWAGHSHANSWMTYILGSGYTGFVSQFGAVRDFQRR